MDHHRARGSTGKDVPGECVRQHPMDHQPVHLIIVVEHVHTLDLDGDALLLEHAAQVTGRQEAAVEIAAGSVWVVVDAESLVRQRKIPLVVQGEYGGTLLVVLVGVLFVRIIPRFFDKTSG
jgi:hypothetical protein